MLLCAAVEGYVIFVSNIHEEADEESLQELFLDYGPIKNLYLNLDRRSGFCKGYALIEYETKEEAEVSSSHFSLAWISHSCRFSPPTSNHILCLKTPNVYIFWLWKAHIVIPSTYTLQKKNSTMKLKKKHFVQERALHSKFSLLIKHPKRKMHCVIVYGENKFCHTVLALIHYHMCRNLLQTYNSLICMYTIVKYVITAWSERFGQEFFSKINVIPHSNYSGSFLMRLQSVQKRHNLVWTLAWLPNQIKSWAKYPPKSLHEALVCLGKGETIFCVQEPKSST